MSNTSPVASRAAARDSSSRNLKAPLLYRLRLQLRNPVFTIGILALALFAYLIVAPIISLLLDAFTVQRQDELATQTEAGSPTTYYFWRAFVSEHAQTILWNPLGNTLLIAAVSVVLSLVIGVGAAWLLVRTNIWGKKWLATGLIVPYMLPAWTFALAWMTIFRNRTVGGQAGWLETFGFTPPNWLSYGHVPIIIIFTLHLSPFVILLVGNALKRFDSTLEESSRLLGASNATTFFKITLPLLRPSLISAVTLILAKVLGEFGVAYILGLPINMNVLATSLYRNIYSNQSGLAAVLVIVIVLIGALSLWADTFFLRESRRFVTISGKSGAELTASKLKRGRLPASLAAYTMFAIGVVIPLGVLILSTLMHRPGVFAFENFTLDYWIGRDLPGAGGAGASEGVFLQSQVWGALWNSFWIVGLAALMAGFVGLLVGYVVVRAPSRLMSNSLRQVVFFPYLVPGIAFAVAYLSLFGEQRGPVPALYGTTAILVLIFFVEQMPFASRAGISAMNQLGADPEEAAQVSGAKWWRRFFTVVLPIQKGAVATGIVMAFISGVKSLSLVIILAVPGMDLLTTLSIRLIDVGQMQIGHGVVLLVALIAFVGTYSVQKLTKTDLSSGIGG